MSALANLDERLAKRIVAQAERTGKSENDVLSEMVKIGLNEEKIRRAKEKRAEESSANILLVTATITEHRELRNEAERRKLPFDSYKGQFATYYKMGKIGSNRVASMQVEMGAFGPGGSAAKCIQARAETQATTLILVGTAFGVNRQEQRMGTTVLVSEAIFPYDDRRVLHVIEPDAFERTRSFIAGEEHVVLDTQSKLRRVRELIGAGYEIRYPSMERVGGMESLDPPGNAERPASETWIKRFRQTAQEFEKDGDEVTLIFGTLLTGGARIESSDFLEELLRSIGRNVVGGEMEAMGALAAMPTGSPGDDAGWIVVKGISDFADSESREKDVLVRNRERAAASAARVVLETLARTN